MSIKKYNAFTLVELLVVVAIISLLVSVNIIAIREYRTVARDAGIETHLVQIRPIAEIISEIESSYLSLCFEGELSEEEELGEIAAIVKKYSEEKTIICHAEEESFCVQTEMAGGDIFCVDSYGYAGRDEFNCLADNIGCREME